MQKLKAAFDWWIFDAYALSASSLAVSRILYALFVLLIIAPGHLTDFSFLASFPDAFFNAPVGPMLLFGTFPPAWVFEGINVLLNLSLVALLLGYRTPQASLLTGLLFFLEFGFYFSFGKIDHIILFLVVPLVMAFSGWGRAYSYDAATRSSRRRSNAPPEAWPLALMALLVGFAMFTAGYAKLTGGWLDVHTQAVQGHVAKNFHMLGRDQLLASFFVGYENPAFWEVLDWTTVFFEMGFSVALLHPVLMRVFVAMAVLFHFGVLLVMNITFASNLAAYAVFFRWERLVPFSLSPLGKAARALRRRVPPAAAVLAVASLFYFVGSPLAFVEAWPASDDVSIASLLALSAGALLVVTLGAQQAARLLRGAPSEEVHA